MHKLKYFILILFIKTSFMGQKADSSAFRLKPYYLGVEFGRSPYRLDKSGDYLYTEINSKILPYFNFMFGYNLKLHSNKYFIPKLGHISEWSNYNTAYKTIESFNGIKSIGTQTVSYVGYKTKTYNQLYINNSSFITLSAEYLQLYNIFKSEKVMLCASAALNVNYQIFEYSKFTDSYSKDSVGINTDGYSYSFEQKKWNAKEYNFCYYSNVAIGILLKNKTITQQISLKLAVRLSDSDLRGIYMRRSLLRITYNLNF